MIYVFKDNQLVHQGEEWPGTLEPFSHLYNQRNNLWYVRYARAPIRDIKFKHVPKEIKMLCLLLGIST